MIYLLSDLHLGHAKVAEIRGMTTEEHDNLLAENWDRMVHKDAHVWVLGDISSGGSQAQRNALRWVSERPGIKHLISGNHDSCASQNRDSHKWLPEYLQVFQTVQSYARRRIAGQTVLLSHYPYRGAGDHTETERYSQYRLPDMGVWLLHGHTHSAEKLSGKMIHVGLDAWDYRPVKLEEIAAIIEENT